MQPQRDCPDLRTLLSFTSGTLSKDDAASVAAHIASCENCRRVIEDFRSDPGHVDRTVDGFRIIESPANIPTVTSSPAEDTDEDVFAILQPANNPKSLGRIGEYEVSRELGRGGMGVVFDAFDAVLHRRVAIKVLAPFLASSKRARQRFLREARASAAIRHPNVVTIHAVNPQAKLPYLVMEYVPGRTLRDRIRLAPMGLTVMLRIAAQLAAGLAAAHAEGVIHRDVKPGNILLEDGIERVKISDFGLAIVALDADELSSADRPVGTPAYMSPEQVSGGKVDARSDLFSLGCVLYAMGTGSSPFQGANSLDIARRVSEYVPPPIHNVNPNVPHFFSDIVTRLLAKDPGQRFQSAKELHELLQEYLTAANLGGSDQLAIPVPPPMLEPAPPTPPSDPPPARRRRWVPAVVAGVAAAAITTVLFAWHPWRLSISERPGGAVQPHARISGEFSVAQDGSADCTSIREALQMAGPGSTIRVLDAATYDEPIVLKSAIRDVTIEATAGAVLENSRTDDAVVRVDGAANLTLRGFRVRARNRQHAILIGGPCEGLTLDRIRAEVPADSQKAAVFFWAGVRGTAEQPIVVRDSEIHGGDIGMVLIGSAERPASHIRVQDCRFFVPGVHIALHDAIADVTLSGNLFINGKAGISVAVMAPRQLQRMTVANNSFYRLGAWLALDESTLDQLDVNIDRNLIVECRQIRAMTTDLEAVATWFHDNWWIKTDGLDEAQAQIVATLKDQVPFLSEDTEHPDFLRPTLDAMPADKRIGALSPRKSKPD